MFPSDTTSVSIAGFCLSYNSGWQNKKPAVDTAGFVGYSKYNVDYLSAAANNGTIIQSTRTPATMVAISFCVFLLNMNYTPLFHERF